MVDVEKEKLLDKLGKLKKMADGAEAIGNEEEAQAFAAMFQRLLMKHKIDMSEVDYNKHLADEPVEEFPVGEGKYVYKGKSRFYAKYPDVEVVSRRIEWIENLAGVLAKAYSCQILIIKRRSTVYFVGRRSDVQIVEYMFITLQRTAEKIAHSEYKKFRFQMRKLDNGGGAFLHHTHGFKASFLEGFVMRLMQRLNEEKRKMEQDNTGMAIMRINKEALAVDKHIEEKYKDKKGAKALLSNQKFNREGYERGKRLADSMNLNANAVQAGQANKQLH
jgi:hypothetical protein